MYISPNNENHSYITGRHNTIQYKLGGRNRSVERAQQRICTEHWQSNTDGRARKTPAALGRVTWSLISVLSVLHLVTSPPACTPPRQCASAYWWSPPSSRTIGRDWTIRAPEWGWRWLLLASAPWAITSLMGRQSWIIVVRSKLFPKIMST